MGRGVDGDGGETAVVVVWACSSNVRPALPIVQAPERTAVVGGVFYYGVSEPAAFRQDRPMLVARAGLDSQSLNRGLDALVRPRSPRTRRSRFSTIQADGTASTSATIPS